MSITSIPAPLALARPESSSTRLDAFAASPASPSFRQRLQSAEASQRPESPPRERKTEDAPAAETAAVSRDGRKASESEPSGETQPSGENQPAAEETNQADDRSEDQYGNDRQEKAQAESESAQENDTAAGATAGAEAAAEEKLLTAVDELAVSTETDADSEDPPRPVGEGESNEHDTNGGQKGKGSRAVEQLPLPDGEIPVEPVEAATLISEEQEEQAKQSGAKSSNAEVTASPEPGKEGNEVKGNESGTQPTPGTTPDPIATPARPRSTEGQHEASGEKKAQGNEESTESKRRVAKSSATANGITSGQPRRSKQKDGVGDPGQPDRSTSSKESQAEKIENISGRIETSIAPANSATQGSTDDADENARDNRPTPTTAAPPSENHPGSDSRIAETLEPTSPESTSPERSGLLQRLQASSRGEPAQESQLNPGDRVRFVQRVSRALVTAGERGGGEVRLRLAPPELGSMRVEVTIDKGNLTAHFEVESSAARNALLDNMPALRERLAEQNVRVAGFSVDVFDGRPDGSPDQPFEDQGNHRRETALEDPSSTSEGEAEETAASDDGAPDALNVVV